MRIEVKEREKSFFDECLYITNFFPRVLRKPNKKVMSATRAFLRTLIGYLIYTIIFIFIGINDNFDTLTVIFLVIFLLFGLLCFIYFLNVKKQIKFYMNDDGKSSFFEINEDGVKVESYIGTSSLLKWDLVKYIIINKETISFLPDKISVTSVVLFVSTKYKDEVVNAIKKYNKEELIIDNSELYK